jgi:hypothetical protein
MGTENDLVRAVAETAVTLLARAACGPARRRATELELVLP